MNLLLWKLENVTLSGRNRPRLADVSLEIQPGVTAILGHSGAGKTSLLNLLVGFEQPDRGTITCEFLQPGDQLPLFWAPSGDGLWPHMTVGQHVRAVLPETGSSEAKVAEFLTEFNLSDKTGEFPDQLSLGERARTALVRALASNARVLVLEREKKDK